MGSHRFRKITASRDPGGIGAGAYGRGPGGIVSPRSVRFGVGLTMRRAHFIFFCRRIGRRLVCGRLCSSRGWNALSVLIACCTPNVGFGHFGAVWLSGLRRWLQAPVRKGVGSNPTAVIMYICPPHVTEQVRRSLTSARRHTLISVCGWEQTRTECGCLRAISAGDGGHCKQCCAACDSGHVR